MRPAARLLPLLAVLAGLLAAGPASAQDPTLGATGTTTPTGLAPIRIHFSIQNQARFPVRAVVTGGRLRVVGRVTPYIAGQTLFVRTFRGDRKLATRGVAVTNAGDGVGHFAALIGVGGRVASISVRVSHPATDLQAGLDATPQSLPAVAPSPAPGQHSAVVRLLQDELADLHYAVPNSGVFDDATQRAVIAFRKMTNQDRTDVADRTVFKLLAVGAGTFKVRYPDQGAHFEGDLTHQVLAEVLPGGKVRRLYEMSSGKPSTPTVIGNFSIYLKTFGINEKGMVDANYFIRGYAIHGYADVPTYAASHGCLRIPVPDAEAVYNWAQYGDAVDVYYRNGGGSHTISSNAGP
ncbi:MAG TPA: L,D-transpeptidase family protein [Solirubrobacteraceae bacterium]|nr:L,D-transpeptidase family protein [Solirubrobacteraceae bacterium]